MRAKNWEDLANAIVIQAAEDYWEARERLRTRINPKEARRRIREVEHFIRSEWFGQLTDMDGEKLIGRLRKTEAQELWRLYQTAG